MGLSVVALLGSGVAQYVGAALAVGLFAFASSASVAWARIAIAGVILLAWRRPWDFPRAGRAVVFGLALGVMNILFYLSIARIPLGAAVALEFLGPVALAATARTRRAWIGIALALTGVVLISWVGLDVSEPGVAAGMALAIAAGLAWAIYMQLGSGLARAGRGIDALAIGLCAAAVAFSPLAWGLRNIPLEAGILAQFVGVAVLSSVIPYAIDQLVLRGIPAPLFAIINSVLPATSLVVGLVMLGQRPTVGEVLGLICVCLAVLTVSLRRK